MGNTNTRVTPYDEEAPPISQEPSTQDGTPALSEIIVHAISDVFYTYNHTNTHKANERLPNGDVC